MPIAISFSWTSYHNFHGRCAISTKVWTGGAADIAQRDTGTVGGTWVQSDALTLTINNQNLVITIGTATTTANVATIVSQAWNASTRLANLLSDESLNIGGQEIPEFTEVTASNSASTVIFTANTSGIPYTLTRAVSSAAGTFVISATQAADGSHFYDNANNWSGATLPVSSDKLVFQNNAIDLLYNISQAATTNVSLQIDASYTGRIGLAPRNPTGYNEYRARHLTLGFASDARSLVIGEGPGSASSRININANTSSPKVVIANTGIPENLSRAAVDLIGGDADMDVTIRRGTLTLASESTNSASVSTLEIGFDVSRSTDAQVYVGDTTTIQEIKKRGGVLTVINASSGAAIATVTHMEGLIEVNGGVGATLLDLQGGELRWHSTGTIGTLKLSGAATFDVSRDHRAKGITNPVERYSDSSRIIDPFQTITNLRIDNNQVSDLGNLILGTDFRITRAATA